MPTSKLIASLSIDLDDKWTYLKTRAVPGWESFPSYLDVLVPRVLNVLKQHDLVITFFIVGQDAALPRNRDLLRSIALAGHEIGNHSFKHEPWLQFYSEQELDTELALAEEHIEHATGERPIGFRGPGYSQSPACLKQLAARGYLYDASSFASLLSPLARAYYLATAKLTAEEKQLRRRLGGTFRDGLRPNRPFRWRLGSQSLLEIPVTTLPMFRVPIHFSYVMCLSSFSPRLAEWYFHTALAFCRWSGSGPSLLLHPTDFLGCDDAPDLSFFPGMSLPSEEKIELLSKLLGKLSTTFAIRTVKQHAREVGLRQNLPTLDSKEATMPEQLVPDRSIRVGVS